MERSPRFNPVPENSLFKGFHSLEQTNLNGVKKLQNEISKYPEFKPRLTFHFPLDKERVEAIDSVRKGRINEDQVIRLIRSPDFVNRRVGESFLKKTKNLSNENIMKLRSLSYNEEWVEKNEKLAEKIKVKIILETQKKGEAVDSLLNMTQYRDIPAVEAASEGLGEIGDKRALPFLEKLSHESLLAVTTTRAKIKIIIKNDAEKALDPLSKMSSELFSNWRARIPVCEAMGNFQNKEVIVILKNISPLSDDEREARKLAISNIIINIARKEGEKSIPWLTEMCQDKNLYIRRPAAQALTRLIIKDKKDISEESIGGIFRLEGIIYDEEIKEVVHFEKNKHQRLLGTQYSSFATPYRKELVDGLMGVQKLSQQLKENFGDKFIGITVFGSASKGYFKNHDMDCGYIVKEGIDREGIDKFVHDKLPQKHIYELFHASVLIDSNNEVLDLFGESERLFQGLFFGDNKKLILLQKTLLEKTRENDWDKLREGLINRETEYFEKLVGRFGLTQEEAEKVKLMTMLTRTPPTHAEALKIVKRNEKRLSKAKKL